MHYSRGYVASNEQNNYHDHCEVSSTSWCQYQRDINKTNFYKHGRGPSQEVIKWVKPIYLQLIKPSELKNAYMGKHKIKMRFNSTIWERAPKVNYCSVDKLEFALYDAVANFNDDRQASIDVLQKMNICAGYKQTSKVFSEMQIKSFHKENKKNYSGGAEK